MYPPKSSASSRVSSTYTQSIDAPTSSSEDTSTSTTEQWHRYFEERPMSFPTEVDVTARDLLRTWTVCSRIPHQYLTNLLKILRQMKPDDASNMPFDARTLLGGAGDLPPVTAFGSAKLNREGRLGMSKEADLFTECPLTQGTGLKLFGVDVVDRKRLRPASCSFDLPTTALLTPLTVDSVIIAILQVIYA
nr:unnamed protein product [Spirometra erinaceieuropaei]